MVEGVTFRCTSAADNPQQLIHDFNTEKHFRITVTVTLVATGTDIPSLEVLLFMRDVDSVQLYTQMRGRDVRTIADDKLRAITPNAQSKDDFFIVDAIGVTEHALREPKERIKTGEDDILTLEKLLELISHHHLPDDNLRLLASQRGAMRLQCLNIHTINLYPVGEDEEAYVV